MDMAKLDPTLQSRVGNRLSIIDKGVQPWISVNNLEEILGCRAGLGDDSYLRCDLGDGTCGDKDCKDDSVVDQQAGQEPNTS